MASTAVYINKDFNKSKTLTSLNIKIVTTLFITFLVGILTLAPFGGNFIDNHSNTKQQEVAHAADFNPIRWLMCRYGKGSIPERVYQYTSTDRLQFYLSSKSSIGAGADDVSNGLNWFLDLDEPNFQQKNEQILGRSLDTAKDLGEQVESNKKLKYNGGEKMNPFDRFGLAGLKFTAYQGEWKYVVVDACNPDAKPTDPQTGLYFDNRLVPQTTWEGLPTTTDTRSMQKNKGYFTTSIMSFLNTISNIIFNVAKWVVGLTIAFIGFTFMDIVKVMGIETMLVGNGDNGSGGMFKQLFEGIFVPLVFMVFAITALNILYQALFKRQFRRSLTSLLRSIFMFFIAFIIAADPKTYVTLPNKVGVVLEAAIVSALNGSVAGGNGLCETNVGAAKKIDLVKEGKDDQDTLDQLSKNMKSTVSCSLWQEFLFKPWAQGQFGTDWNKTWAKGKIPSWAKADGKAEEFNTRPTITKRVGDAEVPLGGGTVVNNWALFNLSVNTTVHAPFNQKGAPGKTTAGVNNDWWRIVDVLSGYDEKQETSVIKATKEGDKDKKESVNIADPDAKPLPEWNTWIGNAGTGRMMTALSAVFISIIGVIGPLFFSLMSCVYTIGVSILMMFAPIMLLMGCWADRGWEVFKAWGSLVLNLVIKRIMYGALMVLSILFSATAIDIMQKDSWWKGILTMIILTFVLFKNRNRIVDAVAVINLSRFSMDSTAKRVSSIIKGGTLGTAKTATMGVTAGTASKQHGGSFKSGFAAGTREQMKNLGYNNSFARHAMVGYQSAAVSKKGQNEADFDNISSCDICGKNLTGSSIVGALPDGGYICEECLDTGDTDAVETTIDWSRAREQQKEREKDIQGQGTRKFNNNPEATVKSNMDDDQLINDAMNPENDLDDRIEDTAKLASKVEDDIREYKDSTVPGLDKIPMPPEEVKNYIPSIATLNQAWVDGEWDYIREVYTLAWTNWAINTFGDEFLNASERINSEFRAELSDSILQEIRTKQATINYDESDEDEDDNDEDEEDNNNR